MGRAAGVGLVVLLAVAGGLLLTYLRAAIAGGPPSAGR
jgi:hypothetical protein